MINYQDFYAIKNIYIKVRLKYIQCFILKFHFQDEVFNILMAIFTWNVQYFYLYYQEKVVKAKSK